MAFFGGGGGRHRIDGVCLCRRLGRADSWGG